MKVLICGSRDWPPGLEDTIRQYVDHLPEDAHVITGGAPGADFWADFWAKQRGLSRTVIKADWDRFGKKAGPIRNRQMLDMDPEAVVAFKTRQRSRGTDDTINEAQRRGIPVEIHVAPASDKEQTP